MIFSFLLCWYALGWASVGVWLQDERETTLSLSWLVFNLLLGAVALTASCIMNFESGTWGPIIVWRRK